MKLKQLAKLFIKSYEYTEHSAYIEDVTPEYVVVRVNWYCKLTQEEIEETCPDGCTEAGTDFIFQQESNADQSHYTLDEILAFEDGECLDSLREDIETRCMDNNDELYVHNISVGC